MVQGQRHVAGRQGQFGNSRPVRSMSRWKPAYSRGRSKAGANGLGYRRQHRLLHAHRGEARRPNGKGFTAFEPDPVNFKLLKKNVEQNGHTNVVLVNKAVADKEKKSRL